MSSDFRPLSSFLSEVLDYRGKTPKKLGSDWADSGFRVLSAANVTHRGLKDIETIRRVDSETYQKWMKSEVRRGDVLLTSEAPAGQVMLWDSEERIVLGQRLFGLRAEKAGDARFLKYYLESPLAQKVIGWRTSGSTVSGISAKMFDHIPVVAIHGPEDRERIGETLAAVDEAIELKVQAIEELEALVRLIYDYWFVQFDFPISAERASAMGDRAYEGRPFRQSGGRMVYSEALKREIPEGWLETTVGEAFETHLGGTPSRGRAEYWTPPAINWLSSGENPSTFVVEPDEMISTQGLDDSPCTLLPRGTVVLSIVRHIRASILGIESATNQSVVGIVETPTIKSCFIHPYSVREIPRLMALRTGAQQPHINKTVVDDSPLLLPDDDTLAVYTELTQPFYEQSENLHIQNRLLSDLREWLLPLLMNGQIAVAGTGREPTGYQRTAAASVRG